MLNDFTNQVIEGDCLRVLQELPEAAADLVLTDPPYLVSYRPRDGRSVAGDQQSDWIEPAFRQLYRVLKADSFCISFYGWTHVDLFMSAWRTAGFRPVGHIVAVKRYASARGYLKGQHEQAFLLAKGSPRVPAATIADVLEWKYTGNTFHPTQKPLSVLLPLVAAFSRPRDIVLDPFAGSGTSLLAAKLTGRRYIGIELDSGYCRTARARLAGEA